MTSSVVGAFVAFVGGACLGSFANVAVIRLREASSLWGRSRCPECRVVIRLRHLVPLVSWIVLGGRCKDCGKPIHVQYPIVECLAGVLMAAAFVRHGVLTPLAVSSFLFESLFSINLLLLAVMDLRFQVVSVEWVAGSSMIFFLWSAFSGAASAPSLFIGGLIGAGFLALQVWISRGRAMGSGDPWVGGMIGLALGFSRLIMSFYSTYILGGVLALILLVTGRARRGTRIPFVPLLAMGALVALWFGQGIEQKILEWWV